MSTQAVRVEVGRDPAKGSAVRYYTVVLPVPQDAYHSRLWWWIAKERNFVPHQDGVRVPVRYSYLKDHLPLITWTRCLSRAPQHSTGAVFGITVRRIACR
jgi:hypothetical protein